MTFRNFALLILTLAGCGTPDTTATGDASTDAFVATDADTSLADAAPSDADADADASAADAGVPVEPDDRWSCAAAPEFEVLYNRREGAVLYERIRYRVGELWIHGVVARPFVESTHPLLVFQHGGFAGLTDADLVIMGYFAGRGAAVFASDYRGETSEFDGLTSDGEVEACAGEVDDTMALACLATHMPYAQADRLVLFGNSHGGCVTTRALERGTPATAAATLAGVLDSRGTHANYEAIADAAALAGDTAKAELYQGFADGLVGFCGGRPDSPDEAVQREWTRRSPLDNAADFPSDTPVLIVHGLRDEVLNYVDNCRFVAAAGGFESRRMRMNRTLYGTVPTGCEDLLGTMTTTALPRPAWSDSQLFLMHDTLDHGGNAIVLGVLEVIFEYVNSRLDV